MTSGLDHLRPLARKGVEATAESIGWMHWNQGQNVSARDLSEYVLRLVSQAIDEVLKGPNHDH